MIGWSVHRGVKYVTRYGRNQRAETGSCMDRYTTGTNLETAVSKDELAFPVFSFIFLLVGG